MFLFAFCSLLCSPSLVFDRIDSPGHMSFRVNSSSLVPMKPGVWSQRDRPLASLKASASSTAHPIETDVYERLFFPRAIFIFPSRIALAPTLIRVRFWS